MAAACRWAVESGKLMYPSTFGHVATCVYMSCTPSDPFLPSSTGLRGVSGKNLEQRMNIECLVRIGSSARETAAILTLAYSEYVMKTWVLLNGIGDSRKDEILCKMTQEMGSQNSKDRCNGDRVRTLVGSDRRLGARLIAELNMGRKDPTSRFSTGQCPCAWCVKSSRVPG
jgi:hypothetical protein